MKKLYIYSLALLGFAACKPNIEPTTPERGDADFSYYLAVGNSLTAGYQDGSLYKTGQINSFPNMLSKQFSLVGGGNFEQPLLPGEYGYPNPRIYLRVHQGLCDTMPTLLPTVYGGALDSATSSNNVSFKGPYNNMGIPGIRCIDFLFPGYGMFNPYAARIFEKPASNRPLDELKKQQHSFFSLWIGNNDVLLYAVNGGEQATGIQNVITDKAAFTVAYDSVMAELTRNGAKGILLNIPDISALPFFNTVMAKGAELTAAQANQLNIAYNGTQVHFDRGFNYFVIEDQTEVTGFRQIKDGEYIRMDVPRDSLKCAGWGTKKPIPARFVLSADEVAKVKQAVIDFNNIIDQMAVKYNVPVVDMYSYLTSLESGITYNGVAFTNEFITGGAFSLDGVHPNPKGYALIANQIILHINSYYKSTLPLIDVNEYPGVLFP